MKKALVILALFAAVVMVGCGAGDPVAEAKKVFKEAQQLAKDGKEAEFKKLVSKKSLAENEKSKVPMKFVFQMLASIKIDEMEAKVEGEKKDKVVFTSKKKDGKNGTMGMEIKMVKEDGAWKLD